MYKIIKTFDINKAHGRDEVSIRMLKPYDKSIAKPLYMIFKNCKLKKHCFISGKKLKKLKKLSPSFILNNFWKHFRKTNI